jgi:hypothetical protein
VTHYAHAHPMGGGRRFEHTHAVDEMPLDDHEAVSLAEAHPELAAVEQAPAPGSPADLRGEAARLRGEAADLAARAMHLRDQAAELDARAAADERHPPDVGERLRRLFQ